MEMSWHIGCSGFSYKEWKNVFYPPKLPAREWFRFYTERFNTLELNFTFYRFPRLPLLQGWYEKSPAGFLFAVKVPRLITHYKQLKDCTRLLHDFHTTCREGLKEKLGPLLFQFPSRFTQTPERISRIVEALDPSFNNVVEFRDASWWDKKVYSALRKHNISFCSTSFPNLPDEIIKTSATIYYRFHGIEKLYYSCYDEASLFRVADAARAFRGVKDVFCFFNNTAAVGAIDNANCLKCYVDKKARPPKTKIKRREKSSH